MKPEPPALSCFHIEPRSNGVVHLVFDLPGRPMNVFTNAAIHELGRFATWLRKAPVTGVVVASAKPVFCAGADLTELGVAYDMIMAAPRPERGRIAFEHFIPLSRALRALEVSGKPVAAAISGLALGGGFELALACHHRVVADAPRSGLGLPESLVGLLPGAGGTQRLPRLIGLKAASPVLLDGQRLSPAQALACGAAHEVVAPGDEVAAAERWVLSSPASRQPWDRDFWQADDPAALLAATRARVLEQSHGHYPAPLAILDCISQGYPLPMDQALQAEMEIFSRLIQRPEPRNMIRSLFIAKTEYERLRAAGTLPAGVGETLSRVGEAMALAADAPAEQLERARSEAGFTRPLPAIAAPTAPPRQSLSGLDAEALPGEESAGYWFERGGLSERQRIGLRQLLAAASAAASGLPEISPDQERLVDHAAIVELGFPAFLGGPFALLRYLGRERLFGLASGVGLSLVNPPMRPKP